MIRARYRMRVALALPSCLVATALIGCLDAGTRLSRPGYGGFLAVSLKNPAPHGGPLRACAEAFPVRAAPDQEITVLVVLTNVSQRAVRINGSMGPYSFMELEIKDGQGRAVCNEHTQAVNIHPKESDFVSLAPGAGFGISLHTIPTYWSMHDAGEYQLRLRCYPFSPLARLDRPMEDVASSWIKIRLTNA